LRFCDGVLSVRSAPNQGTEITAEIACLQKLQLPAVTEAAAPSEGKPTGESVLPTRR